MDDVDLIFSSVLVLILGVISTVGVLLTRPRREEWGFEIKLLWIALFLRFSLSVGIYHFGLVDVLGDEDSGGWYHGVLLQREWIARGVGFFDLLEEQHQGYAYMLALLFYITDFPSRLQAAALNCVIGALTVVLAYRVSSVLFSRRVAERAGWWTCLFPSLVVWSALTQKEAVVILLETIALYSCVRITVSGLSLRYLLLAALAVAGVFPFRFYAAYIAGFMVVATLLQPMIRALSPRGMRFVSSSVFMAVLIAGALLSGMLVLEVGEHEFSRQYVAHVRQSSAMDTGSGVASDYDLETPGGLVLATVVGVTHLILAPFPWQMLSGSSRLLLTTPEVVLWWWLFFFFVVPGVSYCVRRRLNDVQPLLILLVGFGLLYGLMFGNVGLVFRQRAQLLPWLLTFAAVGQELRRARRKGAEATTVDTEHIARPERQVVATAHLSRRA